MDGRFSTKFMQHQDDSETTSEENSGEFQFSGVKTTTTTTTTTTSQKRSRRAVQKRVVTVPIGDVDGSRIKPDGAPPYDSWAWRKYGQKPIKGSPYPRGYYRCSSSKGCPARKQVERSRVDPTMLVITYACDHNHSGPPSRNPSSTTSTSTATTSTSTITSPTKSSLSPSATAMTTVKTSPKVEHEESAIFITDTESQENKFTDLVDEFSWFSDVASTSETVLVESPIYSKLMSSSNISTNRDMDMAAAAMIFPMGEEDELLFADLGELPECSVVFQRGFLVDQEKRRRCSLGAAG
ncbi:WRKY Transcription Factor [Ranunculus cassubicifolius]